MNKYSLRLKVSSVIFPVMYQNAAFSNGRFRNESVESMTTIIIYFTSGLVMGLQCKKGISSLSLVLPEKPVDCVLK